MKRAFTLIELMLVIAVLAILITIVATAASGSIKSARERRRDTMAAVLREGIATYYARNGKWPGGIESKADSGLQKRKVQLLKLLPAKISSKRSTSWVSLPS